LKLKATRTCVVVPVNVLKKSKARLSSVLTHSGRVRLTTVMLENVFWALKKSRRVESVVAVSSDRGVLRIARRFGFDTVWEGERRGLNKGIRLAIARLKDRMADAVLVIHADLPLLTSIDVDRFLSGARGYQVAINPSRDGSGTNALLLNPPDAIPPMFGRHSFKRHLAAARKMGLRVKVMRVRGICFDVDQPRDLVFLRRRAPEIVVSGLRSSRAKT